MEKKTPIADGFREYLELSKFMGDPKAAVLIDLRHMWMCGAQHAYNVLVRILQDDDEAQFQAAMAELRDEFTAHMVEAAEVARQREQELKGERANG